ncbi:MAG: VWA domain-containing protein [Vicinamibacterales bacterium]
MRKYLLLTACALLLLSDLRGRAQVEVPFRGGVEVVNVTVTVTDPGGEFLGDLTRDDFAVYEDGQPQPLTEFSAERVPVSLGLLLDASSSMNMGRMRVARAAVDRLATSLLHPDDELFLVAFSTTARLLQPWTTDRRQLRQALEEMDPGGATALLDALADSLPLATEGRHAKKVLLLLSDGNDTASDVPERVLRERLRDTDVLVYALGIDSTSAPGARLRAPGRRAPFPVPLPFPGGGPRRGLPFPQTTGQQGRSWQGNRSPSVDADALRRLTDDTGGRTEILRDIGELDEAVTRLADELSRQYFLAYERPATSGTGWHDIRVEVHRRGATVRARRGYRAS